MNGLQSKLVERFLRYVAVESQSLAAATKIPSTEGQLELARLIKNELIDLGLSDIKLTDQAILTAKLPARLPPDCDAKIPAIGFLAHLDTVDVNLNPSVNPRIVKNYSGGDILLNRTKDIWLKADQYPALSQYSGQDILVTDGTSVLGADNKAAIAAILTAVEQISANPAFFHGDILLAFVPDEEIGLRGSKAMDLADFPAAFAYTVDSCELGEVVYETFNAGSAVITIQGVTAHPMSAKGILVNPALIVNDFINQLDPLDTPEHTEGKEGYFWVTEIAANSSRATIKINIRDFAKNHYETRKTFLANTINQLAVKHPKAKIDFAITDTYGNIADALPTGNRACIDYIYQAMENLGITPKTIAMRGGTDGSALSARGIPTPNFFTGAHNFHSNCEFLPAGSFEKSCRMIMEIVKLVIDEKTNRH